jgi:hypothetical protein
MTIRTEKKRKPTHRIGRRKIRKVETTWRTAGLVKHRRLVEQQ